MSSLINLNYERLRANPFLIPNVLERLCGNSSSQALFKYRLVGSLWNQEAVKRINEEHEGSIRLIKVVGPDFEYDRKKSPSVVVAVNINELNSTLSEGKLKKSTLTRIYFNSSVSPFGLNTFLQLNGQNIQTLHYDGDSLEKLRKILHTCARNLMSVSLWKSWKNKKGEGLWKSDDDEGETFKFPRLQNLIIVSGELNVKMDRIKWEKPENNHCSPSKKFLSDLFQASPNLTSLSARFAKSSILKSGLSFNKLTTLCIKFQIRSDQLRALCHVGLRLRKLRLQGLFVDSDDWAEDGVNYYYMDDIEWMEFRRILLNFIQTQANTLEYFAVSLFVENDYGLRTGHDSPHEQWSSTAGFPRMPNLHTFILYACSGKIPKEEFGYLFPKLRNLETVWCGHGQGGGPSPPNITEYPLHIPTSRNPSISVQNIRGMHPTLELAQIFPSVIEVHLERIPHQLPLYWPNLKHLYCKDSCSREDSHDRVLDYIRQMNGFLVGILPEESKWIELQRFGFCELTALELPRSRPSIFDLRELETFEFGFSSYEFEPPLFGGTGIEYALQVLISLGLSRLTHLKKMNFVLEQKPRPSRCYKLPKTSLDGLAKTFGNRECLNVQSNWDESARKPMTKKWTFEFNLDHHKSEWKEVDGLFRDDPDICELGLQQWNDDF